MIQRTTTSKRSITLSYTLHNLFDTVSFLLGKQTRMDTQTEVSIIEWFYLALGMAQNSVNMAHLKSTFNF